MKKKNHNIPNVQTENVPSPNIQNRVLDDVPSTVQAGSGVDSKIRVIHRERFNNTEIRRRVNFSSVANVSSFTGFYRL